MKEDALKLADDLDAMKLFGASGMIRRLVEELDKQEKLVEWYEIRASAANLTARELRRELGYVLRQHGLSGIGQYKATVPLTDRKSTRLNSSH